MVEIETDFDFEGFEREAITKLNLFAIGQNELKDIGKIVVDDIREGIEKQVDLNNVPLKPNTPEWVKRKGHDNVLIGKTHNLYNSFKSEVFGVYDAEKNNGAVLEITARGGGLYWQTNPKNPVYKRDFFGISERAIRKIGNYLRNKFGG
jgi:hypothetical protein